VSISVTLGYGIFERQLTTVTLSNVTRSEPSSEARNPDSISFHWQGRDLRPPFSPIGLIMDDASDMDSKVSAASSPEQKTHPSPLQHRRVASMGAETQPKSDSALLRASFYSTRKPDDDIGHSLDHQKDNKSGQDFIRNAITLHGKTTTGKTTNVLRRTVSSEATPERPKALNFARGGRSLSFGSIGTKVTQRDSLCAYMAEASPMETSLRDDKFSELSSDTYGVVEHVKVPADVSEARDDDAYTSNMTRLEFEAPRNGQLGLILEAENAGSITVRAVKDYSPLLGLVQPGDKIVEIDHIDTTTCNLEDMTRLLKATKPSLILPSESYQPEHQFGHNLNVSILRSHSDDGSLDQVG